MFISNNNNQERWYCIEGKCQQDIDKKHIGTVYKNKQECESKCTL